MKRKASAWRVRPTARRAARRHLPTRTTTPDARQPLRLLALTNRAVVLLDVLLVRRRHVAGTFEQHSRRVGLAEPPAEAEFEIFEAFDGLRAQVRRDARILERARVGQLLEIVDRLIELLRREPLALEFRAECLRIGETLLRFAAELLRIVRRQTSGRNATPRHAVRVQRPAHASVLLRAWTAAGNPAAVGLLLSAVLTLAVPTLPLLSLLALALTLALLALLSLPLLSLLALCLSLAPLLPLLALGLTTLALLSLGLALPLLALLPLSLTLPLLSLLALRLALATLALLRLSLPLLAGLTALL